MRPRIQRNLAYNSGVAAESAAGGGGGGPSFLLRDTFSVPDGPISTAAPEVDPEGTGYVDAVNVDIFSNYLRNVAGGTGFTFGVLGASSSPENFTATLNAQRSSTGGFTRHGLFFRQDDNPNSGTEGYWCGYDTSPGGVAIRKGNPNGTILGSVGALTIGVDVDFTLTVTAVGDAITATINGVSAVYASATERGTHFGPCMRGSAAGDILAYDWSLQ